MNTNQHPDCFGKMFPDVLRLQANTPNCGKVFTITLTRIGGTQPGYTHRSIETDVDQWDECRQCSDFESCYKLCLAKVAEESVVLNQ